MKKFSIVVPIYFNAENIPFTIPRLQKLEEIIPSYEFEFVFVDDGSRDDSYRLLLEAKKNDQRIKVVKLSKNFGSMSAIQAGLEFVTGNCTGVITADLQDPPEIFAEMIQKWEQGNKVVMARRSDREESFFQKFFANIYYALLEKFALPGYPQGGFDFVLVDEQIVREIKAISEKNTNIFSLIFWLGHKQHVISYVRKRREHGKSRWTLSKKVKLFTDSFIGFSYAPIRAMSLFGFVVAIVSFVYGIIVVTSAISGEIDIKGWSSMITITSFLLGIIIVMLGIIGEYLWRILDETRKRPAYIIDEIHNE